MCGRYTLKTPAAALVEHFEEIGLERGHVGNRFALDAAAMDFADAAV